MEHPAAQQAKRCFADRSTLCCRRPDRAFAQYRVFLIHAALAGQPQDRQGTLLSAGAVLCTGAGQRTAGIQNNKAGIGYQFCAGRLLLP